MGQGRQYQSQGAAQAQILRQAIGVMAWVEVEDKAQRPGLWGPRGLSTPLHHKLRRHISRLWARILFDSSASHSFIAASCVKELGLEVENLEKPLHVSSPLGTRVRVDMICQDCELEISGILLIVNLRVWTCRSLMSSSGWTG